VLHSTRACPSWSGLWDCARPDKDIGDIYLFPINVKPQLAKLRIWVGQAVEEGRLPLWRRLAERRARHGTDLALGGIEHPQTQADTALAGSGTTSETYFHRYVWRYRERLT
jgi:hypothetical protein